MSEKKRLSSSRFRFADFLVVLLCFCGAVVSFNLFWHDLFQTINSQNKKTVGIVTIRKNTVQRQVQGRVIWDRPFAGASIYEGDMIRITDSSSLGFKHKEIEVEFIDYQIRRIPPLDADGTLRINGSGNMVVKGGAGGGNVIVNDKRIETGPGTVIKIDSREDGTKIKILEGDKVRIIDNGEVYERSAGETITWDSYGTERTDPSVVVTNPRPNTQFFKINAANANVGFAWIKKDIEKDAALRLEISENRNFTKVVHVRNYYDNEAQVSLESGVWYWRLLYKDKVIEEERFTITEAASTDVSSSDIVLPMSVEEPVVEPAPKIEEPSPPKAPPLLPAPGKLTPSTGYRFSANELRRQKIDFKWASVKGANGYIYSLFLQGASGRQLITQRQLGNRTNITLDNFTLLNQGRFIWQVEAINTRRSIIERRGKIAESSFLLNIPAPAAPNTLRVEELPEGSKNE